MSETRWPLIQYSPFVGESRQPIRFISVDFPEPEGPMIARYSPFLTSKRHVAERVQLFDAHLVCLPDVVHRDQRDFGADAVSAPSCFAIDRSHSSMNLIHTRFGRLTAYDLLR